jgi:hypothetical protein
MTNFTCDICGACSKRPKYLQSKAHLQTKRHTEANREKDINNDVKGCEPEVINYLNFDENVQPINITETKVANMTYKIKESITDKAVININENNLKEFIENHNTGFEVIIDKVRGYFDFDIQYETKTTANNNELTDITNAKTYATVITGDENVKILTANGLKNNGKYVNSIHIITPTIYNSGQELLNKINNYDGDIKIQPDRTVYCRKGKMQLFRLPYTSKKGETRPLVLTDIVDGKIVKDNCIPDNDTLKTLMVSVGLGGGSPPITPCTNTVIDDDVRLVMDIFRNAMPEESPNWKYKSTKEHKNGTTINLKRLHGSHCEFCNRVHDNDDTAYLFKFNNGNVIFGCCRLKGATKLIHKPIKEELKEIDADVLTSQYMSQFESAGFNVSVHNEKYCTDIKEFMDCNANLIGIRANMGTGKTFANSQVVANILRENPNARILVISMRISLAKKYSKDYPEFTCYLYEKERGLNDDRLICQLDSLYRIRDSTSFDMVVIDEVDQSLRHIVSKTYMKNQCVRRNIKMFNSIIKHSKQVILMSANLTVKNMKYIRKLRRNSCDTNMVFYNQYVPRRFKILITKHTADIVSEIIQDLKHARKVYIASNYGVKKLEEVKRQLLEYKPNAKILVICSTTLDNDDVKKAIADPDVEWGNYDVIITSPSVQGGVSYDVKNKIDKVYGMFINTTNSSGDACQMLRRVRHPKSSKILISYKKCNGYIPIYDRDEMIASIIKKRNIQFQEIESVTDYYINSYGVEEFVANDYFNLYIDTLIETNKDRANWIQNFRDFQVMYGNTVCGYKSSLDENTRKEIDQKGSDIKQQIGDEHNIELANAVSIDAEQDSLLQKKMRFEQLTAEEQLKHQKFVITNAYNLKEVDDAKWFETYDDMKHMKIYKNLVVYYKEDRNLDDSLEDLKNMEHEADMRRRTKLVDASDNTWEARDTTEAIIRSLVSDTHRYGKQRLLINMIKDMGFNSFESDAVIDSVELKKRVDEFKKMDFETMGSLLEKPKRRMLAIKNSNEKTYFKNMMRFINGAIESEFGVRIKPVKRNSSDYMLYNQYIQDGLFVNPWKPTERAFGDNTPILGRVEIPKKEVVILEENYEYFEGEDDESDYDDY